MFRPYLLTLLLLLGSLRGAAYTEKVILQSLDGHPTALTLYYKPLGGQSMSASIPTDRLLLDGKGAISTKVLGRCFLQVTSFVPAGTGMAEYRTVVLCIDKGRLHQALLTTSYWSSYLPSQDSTRIFSLRLQLTGTDSRTFQLALSEAEHTFKGFPEPPRLRHVYARTLRFDADRHCFYLSRKAINKTLLVDDGGKQMRQHLAGPYPYVLIGHDQHYLINGDWYEVVESEAYPGGACAFKHSSR